MKNSPIESRDVKKIALYTNILSPYRKHLFDLIYEECKDRGIDFKVFVMSATEPDRNWEYDTYKAPYTQLLECKTLVVRHAYIHFNRNLITTIKSFNPDVMICSGSYLCPGVWTIVNKKKKLGYKCFFWSESHLDQKRDNSSIESLILEKLRSRFYKKFDAFFYAGELSYDFIRKYAKENPEGIFVPNIVDETKFSKAYGADDYTRTLLRVKYNLPLEKKVMILPARLSKVKGIDAFLRLFNQCRNKDEAYIAIAGDGELREEITNLISKDNLPVALLGYKNEKEMIELYSASDIFLLPSLSDPNPLSCIEALWCGLPLFISDKVGNYIEVLEEGQNGYVFSYDDKSGTIAKLEKIISAETEWYRNAGNSSRQRADMIYNSKKNVERIVEELSGADI